MTKIKIISLLITINFLFACGSENLPSKTDTSEKTTDILFESHRNVLENAKDVEKVFADDEQKRKDKMNELGL